jgi:peptide/nickel transport system permease protein
VSATDRPDDATPAGGGLEGPRGRARPRWQETLRLLARNRLAAASLLILLLVVAAAAVGPWLAPYGINEQNLSARLSPPSLEHWFGTDELGRDVFSRVIYGARVSLQVGVVAVGLSLVAGTVIGLVAGYRGGWIDAVLMRLMDIVFSFPVILLAIAIVAVLQPSLFNVMLAIAVVFTPILARVVRGSVLSVREEVHIRAVRSLGASDTRIVLRHILPNVAAPIIVQTSLSLAFAILTEAALSYLGIGIQPPRAAWGADLQSSQAFLASGSWWMAVFPGLAILVTVMAFNLLGDGLRDVLDPKQRSVIESRGVA